MCALGLSCLRLQLDVDQRGKVSTLGVRFPSFTGYVIVCHIIVVRFYQDLCFSWDVVSPLN